MNLVCYAQPSLEPITLAELKTHLRLDSETFAGNVALTPSLAAGSHSITSGYALLGSWVEVIGKQAVVYLQPVNNGTGGTVDVKIQETDDITGTPVVNDWIGGAFTQITEANDTTGQEKAYTGSKRYIRTAAKVLVSASEFGTSILTNEATTSEDDDLTDLIKDGREQVEAFTRHKLLTQTWDYYLEGFPINKFITIPFGNLQSVASIKYTDCDGVETPLIEDTDYLVQKNGDQHGLIVLPYGKAWPSVTLSPDNPIAIRFICGWTAASDLPKNIKRAVKFAAEDAYYHGDRRDALKSAIESLLWSSRLWGTF